MRVLAIDPGYDRVGVAVLEKRNTKDFVVFSTCLETSKTMSFNQRLLQVGQEIANIIDTHSPNCLAIETLFFNKNIKTALGVAEARGIIIYEALQAGCLVYEFGPQEIKIATTGYGKSDKTAVFTMVKRLVINAPEKGLDDEYDAIAIGITCLAQHSQSR